MTSKIGGFKALQEPHAVAIVEVCLILTLFIIGGCIKSTRPGNRKEVVTLISPEHVQDTNISTASCSELYKLIGKPVESQKFGDSKAELLDNSFVWVACGSNSLPMLVWFSFDDSINETIRHEIVVQWKGNKYPLNENTTPNVVKDLFKDAKSIRNIDGSSNPRAASYLVCDETIMIQFWDEKITKVVVFPKEK